MKKEDIFPNPDMVITYVGSHMVEEKGDMEYGVRKILLTKIYSGRITGDEIFYRDIFQETLWEQNLFPTFKKVNNFSFSANVQGY